MAKEKGVEFTFSFAGWDFGAGRPQLGIKALVSELLAHHDQAQEQTIDIPHEVVEDKALPAPANQEPEQPCE
ncbi:MAG TPA: hypothetical protein PLB89_04890 [Flavobacteriales bacterium]|nr:hypothetical protein [Flavobacteriales bacterium]